MHRRGDARISRDSRAVQGEIMITMRATGQDGKEIIGLGVTRRNVESLIQGRPISLTAETHPGFPENLRVLIFFGENERTLTEQVRSLIDPEHTKVIAVPRD